MLIWDPIQTQLLLHLRLDGVLLQLCNFKRILVYFEIMEYNNYSRRTDPILFLFLSVLSIFIIFPSSVHSGVFRVTPIKMVFDREVKTGIVNVINDADEPLQVQMNAFKWTQDQEGKDQYTETKDIIFFPKIMSLEKDESRILRAGIKMPAAAQEKTYRLFVKEIPSPKEKQEGSQVQVAIRFGIPVFVKPVKEEIKGEITGIALGNGKIKVGISNTGNTHFIIEAIKIKGLNANGEEIFFKELSGWYLLAGATRSYETLLSQEACQDTAKFDVEVKTNQFTLNNQLDVIETLCLP